MGMAFRVAVAVTVVVTGLTGAAGTSAAASLSPLWHPPASSAASALAAGARPATQPPGGTKLWGAQYVGRGNYAQANAVAVSPDGSKVFVTGSPATVAYNAATGTRLWAAAYGGTAAAAVVSPDGSTVFVTGADATIAYDTATGTALWAQSYPGVEANQVAVSPNGQQVVVSGYGSGQDTTIAYNAATGAPVWTEQFPSDAFPGGLAMSPDGSSVIVAGSDGSSQHYETVAYDLATGSTRWSRRYHGPYGMNQAESAAISPDGSTVFVSGQSIGDGPYDNATLAYDAATGATKWTRVSRSYANDPALAVSPDGSTVFITGAGYSTSKLTIATVAYDAASGVTLWTQLHASAGDSVEKGIAVSPDGSAVYVAGWEPGGILTLAYRTGTGTQLWRREQSSGGEGLAVAVDPNGSAVFVTGLYFPAGGRASYMTLAYSP